MMRVQRMLLGAGVSLVLGAGSMTVALGEAENPYQNIVDRNVFALKPPPVPPAPAEAAKAPPPKITLTGIMTILGGKRALMKATPPSKDKEPAKEVDYMLSEGQRDGDIEVLEIDEKAGMVKVDDFGTITNLTFEKDGVKGNGPAGGAPSPGTPNIPTPTAPAANPYGNPGGGIRSIPRPLRLPGAMGGGTPSAAAGGTNPTYGGTGATSGGAPGVSVNGQTLNMYGNAAPGQQQQQAPSNMTYEQGALMMEANAQLAQQQNDVSAALYPPSVLNPTRNAVTTTPAADAANGGTTQNSTQTQPTLPIPGRPPGYRPY